MPLQRSRHARRRFRFRPAARADRRPPGRAARRGAAAGGPAPAGSPTARIADLPDLLRPRRSAGRQRHRGHPGAADRPARRGDGSRSPCIAISAAARGAPSPRARGGCSPATASRSPRISPPTVAAKHAEGDVTLALRPRGRGVPRRARAPRRDAAAALYQARRRAATRATARDYQTMFAAPGRRGRRADRRAAFHAGAARRRSTARGIGCGDRDAACRRRHLPAGQGRRHRASTACTPNAASSTPAAAARINAARGARRPHRRGRHDQPAPARKRRRRETGEVAPVRRRDRALHHCRAIASARSTCC